MHHNLIQFVLHSPKRLSLPICLFHRLSQGGMKAVIWTDVFQIAVMLSGFMAIFIQGTIQVGSPGLVLEIAKNGSRLNFDEYEEFYLNS